MDLINTSALPSRLDVAPQPKLDVRVGLLLAKATFRWDEQLDLALDTQDPVPLWLADEPTPLGLLPRDDLPRDGDGFEIVILGRAHSETGAPITSRRVAFSLGGRRRELCVTGDREWEGDGAAASEPLPFESIPLGWERAFGGTVMVEIDEGSEVPLVDTRNPAGRGFDPAPMARALGDKLRCPPPYPRWEAKRLLPNVEAPDALVTRWGDSPDPAGWGAPPIGSPLATSPFRASREGIFDTAPTERHLVLEGLAPGAPLGLRVPDLEVVVDAAVGDRRTTKALREVRWVIEPEDRRMTVTYRFSFSLARAKGEAGSMRLRVG